MDDNWNPYDIDDLLSHPRCVNDVDFNLETTFLQLEAMDIADKFVVMLRCHMIKSRNFGSWMTPKVHISL